MASEKILKMKEEEVKKLAEKMKDASLVLLTDYRGITVADVTELRSTLRKINAEYYVVKNNITKRALNKNGITELDDKLVGPTAVIIAKEEYLPALKAIYAYSKDHDFYQMKSGVLDGKLSDVVLDVRQITNGAWREQTKLELGYLYAMFPALGNPAEDLEGYKAALEANGK